MPLLPGLTDYNIPVLNDSGEEIPPYAVMEISGWEYDLDGQDFVKVKKPTNDEEEEGEGESSGEGGEKGNVGKEYLINGYFPIGTDSRGMASTDWGAKCLIEPNSEIEIGQTLTPASDEWHLEKGEGEFSAVGDITDTTARVRIGSVGKSSGPYIPVEVVNKTGSDLTVDFPVVVLGNPASEPEENPLSMEVEKPGEDSGGDFIVVQGPLESDGTSEACLQGLTWVMVDIKDTDHEKAVAIDGDTTKLESVGEEEDEDEEPGGEPGGDEEPEEPEEPEGVRIRWKPPGTGEKLCVVEIGGGVAGGSGGEDVSVGAGLIVTTVEPASFNEETGLLTYGVGEMRTFVKEGTATDKLSATEENVYTSVSQYTPNGRIVQWKEYNGRKVIDVEDCSQ